MLLQIRKAHRPSFKSVNWVQRPMNFPIRTFFWGKNDDDANSTNKPTEEPKEETAEVIVEETNSNSKDLVSQFGDNSPRFNPVITIPLGRKPLIPGFLSTVLIRDEKTAHAITKQINSGKSYFGLFLRSDYNTSPEIPELITDPSQLCKVGTFAQVTDITKNDHGSQLILLGHRRISLNQVTGIGPPILSDVTHWTRQRTLVDPSPAIRAHCNEILLVARELITLNPLVKEMMAYISKYELSDPYKLADFAAAMTTAEGQDLQKVLESQDPEERLSLALDLLTKERELAKVQMEIRKQVEERMSKQQREYFLREQLKSIKKELGIEKDDKDEVLSKYTEKFSQLKKSPSKFDPRILTVCQEEMEKLSNLEKNSSEFNVTKAYLDWIFSLPWTSLSEDRLHLKEAKQVLDNDHFGMEEIKKRILEFIAVGKLKGSVSGKIVCFIGPPGVGKTSIAKSVAQALNRKFYRFSVGGLTDIAEIKGHRRTYIGAMPGKPIQCLKQVGSMNPLILIDEIDKLGRGHQGDPASALLELLDPNQNTSFVDHYLDLPVDFSNILFVCTANDESLIPGPLRDRMEIIRLSGYDIPEKVQIAARYLVPKALRDAGLELKPDPPTKTGDEPLSTDHCQSDPLSPSPEVHSADPSIESSHLHGRNITVLDPPVSVTFSDEALEALVRNYCRESGVRSLEKHIEKISRKIAFELVEKHESDSESTEHTLLSSAPRSILIQPSNLEQYVGQPKYPQETLYSSQTPTSSSEPSPLPVGVVMALAWNPLGGSALFIETAAIPSSLQSVESSGSGSGTGTAGNVGLGLGGANVNVITGQLGSVMKESVNIAFTFARQFLSHKEPSLDLFFRSHSLHLHVPEGAVEKDGPSAGVAMTSALVSLALGRPLLPRTAMTGEISLTGKVLPVGGIKEKVLAARRAGADTVLLPQANQRDFQELPTYVRESVTVHFISDYQQAFDILFPNTLAPPTK